MSGYPAWQSGRPPEHGYYLAAWEHPPGSGHLVVSELWFNPDAIGTGWFASRGYLRERSDAQTLPVHAWMRLPDPPALPPAQPAGQAGGLRVPSRPGAAGNSAP